MMASIKHPVPPAESGASVDPVPGASEAFDRRLTASVETRQPAAPRPRASEPEDQPRVVRAVADRLLRQQSARRLATLRAFGTRTLIRMIAIGGWLSVALAVGTVVGLYLLAEPVTVVSPPVAPLGFVLFGTGAGLIAWIAGAMVSNRTVMPAHANPRSYDDLAGRMLVAEASIQQLVDAERLDREAAAVRQLGELTARLEQPWPDPDWATGVGYVNAWRDLHRVELALVDVVDASELDLLLRHDALRVVDSKLDRKDSLVRTMIEEARRRIDAGRPGEARSLVTSIREAVNDFRDKRFEALVRNRMHIDRVSLLLGLAAWALLCLGILAGADRSVVTGVSAFYLVGAATGLFTQLRSGVGESLEDVFGYGQAQLRQIVLLSGLAGVAGVFLTSVVGAATTDRSTISILDALRFSPVTVVTAAAFGLAPGTLTDRLNGWAKANLRDLESTSGASGGQGSQGT